MRKNVIADCLMCFHPGNLNGLYFLEALLLFLSMLCMFNAFELQNGFVFYPYLISACVGMVLADLCGKRPSKIMYLMPMSGAERRRYAIMGYRLRVAVPLIIYAFWAGGLMAVGLIGLAYYLTGLGVLLLCNGAVQTVAGARRTEEFIGAFQVFVRVWMFASFFLYYVLCMADKTALYIIWSVVVLASVPGILKLTRRDYNNMLRKAEDYENND